MIKDIIIPTDFSELSLKSLELATVLSKYFPIEVQLVYVMKKGGDYTPRSVEDERLYAKSKLEEIIASSKIKFNPGTALNYIIKDGKVHEEVAGQAHSFPDSMIICSTHGASGFEEAFIGSNTYRIVCAADRPVLTINKTEIPKQLNKILVPITLIGETRQKVPFATELAKALKAEVHVLGASYSKGLKAQTKIRAYVYQVKTYMRSKGIEPVIEVVFGDAINSIIEYADNVNADLIVTNTEKASGLSLILGNNTHLLLNKSRIPVLNIPPKQIKISGSFSAGGG
jgi:nucleotide-binding universal stress UspA family protein